MSRAGRTNLLLILRLLRPRNLDFLPRKTLIILPKYCPNSAFCPKSRILHPPFFAQVLPLGKCWVDFGLILGRCWADVGLCSGQLTN